MQKNKILITILFFLFGIISLGEELGGYWITKDRDIILKVYQDVNEKYKGKVVWLDRPYYLDGDLKGIKVRDDKNKNPLLKEREVMGLILLKNFVKVEDGYQDGRVYDFRNGKTYYSDIVFTEKGRATLILGSKKGSFFKRRYPLYKVEDYKKYNLPPL